MYVLILAGGTGTRLWPISRKSSPKQLSAIIGQETLVQATVKRVLPIVPTENIFFSTNRIYSKFIKEQLPNIPPSNIIEEPSGKNTAACIGLATMHLHQLDPEAVMVSLHSDHFITDEESLQQAILAAVEVAQQGYLATLGVTPTRPDTGYGYIKRGLKLGQYHQYEVYQVAQFLEKPDFPTAQRFVTSGEYYWNTGMFAWKISTLLEAFQEYMPKFYQQLTQIEQAIQSKQSIEPIWQQIEPQSIDVGIMEQSNKVAVVPVNFGWDDVGSWEVLYKINEKNEQNNVVLNSEHVSFDSSGLMIQGNGRFIATIGLKDIIIVDTDDALLICAKDKSQDAKKVVEWLKAHGRIELI